MTSGLAFLVNPICSKYVTQAEILITAVVLKIQVMVFWGVILCSVVI
jgi:hypothetical protein